MPTYKDLPFIDKVKTNQQAFGEKIIQVSADLGISPNWLMIVINNESAGTFSPSIKNPLSTATGLIQFLESTALRLGTSTAQLAQMSNVQQLDYVKKYLMVYKGKMKSAADTYLAVFYPAAIGKPPDYTFPASIVSVNKIFDLNKNGLITKAEFDEYVNKKYAAYLNNAFELQFNLKKK